MSEIKPVTKKRSYPEALRRIDRLGRRRNVLAWELSSTLDVTFCLTALERSLRIS